MRAAAAPAPAQAEVMQRAIGHVSVGARAGPSGTVLRTLDQSGCLRACFPRTRGGTLEAVLVNTAGGIADGDRLTIAASAERGARMVVTTQSAERIYRARPDASPASIEVTLQAAEDASLIFLPQETILFDSCALERTLQIDLHSTASYLGVEALVFGRQEFGETISSLRLRDTIRLRRGGRLLLHDSVRLQGEVDSLLATQASAAGARGVATIVYAAPCAEQRLPALRQALASAEGGASAWDGMLVARLVAPDGQALRRSVLAALAPLRSAPLPRVWQS